MSLDLDSPYQLNDFFGRVWTQMEQWETRSLRMVQHHEQHGAPLALSEILGCPPQKKNNSRRFIKMTSGDTTRAYPKTTYRWTAHCIHPVSCEMLDKSGTHALTDNIQFFVWHGSQNLCQTMTSTVEGQMNRAKYPAKLF